LKESHCPPRVVIIVFLSTIQKYGSESILAKDDIQQILVAVEGINDSIGYLN
jgi:hypothetical protein